MSVTAHLCEIVAGKPSTRCPGCGASIRPVARNRKTGKDEAATAGVYGCTGCATLLYFTGDRIREATTAEVRQWRVVRSPDKKRIQSEARKIGRKVCFND